MVTFDMKKDAPDDATLLAIARNEPEISNGRIAGVAVMVPLAFSAGANLGRSGTALSLVGSASYAGSIAGPGLIGNVADHLGLRVALGIPLAAALIVVMLAAGLRTGQSAGPRDSPYSKA